MGDVGDAYVEQAVCEVGAKQGLGQEEITHGGLNGGFHFGSYYFLEKRKYMEYSLSLQAYDVLH